MTRRYVAISWPEAIRLANLDGTPPHIIRCTYNTKLIHRTDWWALWEDERLTTAIGLPEELRPEKLSTDSESLIFDVWTGGLLSPQCGWSTLAKVESLISSKTIRADLVQSNTATSTWEKITLLFTDGQHGSLYRHRYQKGADYRCNITFEPPLTECD